MKKNSSARVGPVWQQAMLDKLAKDPADYREAWGLFSEGGWANAGQVMVYGTGQDHLDIVGQFGNFNKSQLQSKLFSVGGRNNHARA